MKKIRISLDTRSIDKAIKELQKYENNIEKKCQEFTDALANLGIEVAQTRLIGGMDGLGMARYYVTFDKEFRYEDGKSETIMIMADSMPMVKSWLGVIGKGKRKKEVIKTAFVSPTLMYEFGSGIYASADSSHTKIVNAQTKVGKGTFPSDKNLPQGNVNHAKRHDSWSWKDTSGNWHSSSGIAPTMPMYSAYLAMFNDIENVAKQVFRGM